MKKFIRRFRRLTQISFLDRRGSWALLICGLFLSGCFTTIAPKPVAPRAVAFDNGVQNAAILGYDRTGLIVTKGWITKYDALLKTYGAKLPADNQVPSGDRTGITPRGENFHVQFEVNDRFADLKYFERNSTSP